MSDFRYWHVRTWTQQSLCLDLSNYTLSARCTHTGTFSRRGLAFFSIVRLTDSTVWTTTLLALRAGICRQFSTVQMPSTLDFDNKRATEDSPIEQEEDSRPSSVNQVIRPRSDEGAQDKEAQLDTRSTRTTESALPPPPDGGLHAWLKVFGGFMIYINIWFVGPMILDNR